MAHEREEPLMAALRAASRAESGAPIRSGIFVLANTLLGAGMLGLPAAFGQCGYVTGTVFILCFAVCACTGLHLLSEAADLVGRPSSFNRLANAAVPGGGVFFDLAIAIKCFGVATSYLIVVGDNLPRAMAGFGVTAPLLLRRRTWILASLLAAGPLAFMRRISALRHTCVCQPQASDPEWFGHQGRDLPPARSSYRRRSPSHPWRGAGAGRGAGRERSVAVRRRSRPHPPRSSLKAPLPSTLFS